MSDRITSFSVKPTDKEAIAALTKLRQHSETTGISFSHLVIKAIIAINKELKL